MCSLKGTLQQFHQRYLGDHKPLTERLKSQSGTRQEITVVALWEM